jgi:hypothetical protein
MPRLDRDTADRLLAGRVAPDDAPPGYADLARLVIAVSGPPAPRELIRLEEDVGAAAATRSRRRASTSARREASRPRSRLARMRNVALVAAGAVVATSGLAVAGVLPDPVQDVVSDVLSRVGITVPAGDEQDDGDPPGRSGSPVSPVAVVPERSVVDAPAPTQTTPREWAAEPRTVHVDETKPGHGPPSDTPGNGPPEHAGNGPPSDTPGNGPPEHAGNGPPSDTPGNGPPVDTPGNGPPADPGGGQGGPPPGHGN